MLNINFNPFPQLVTDRLVLRQMTEADKEDVFQFRSSPQAMEFIPRDLAVVADDAMATIDKANNLVATNEGVVWGITRKEDNKVIGTMQIFNISKDARRAEVGYMLHPAYHRMGIMQEALTACLDYGFKVMNLHSMEGLIVAENAASARLLEKMGFVKEGHFKEHIFFRSAFYDSIVYSLLGRNWVK